MIDKHWTHTEYVDETDFKKFRDYGTVLESNTDIQNNTGVFIQSITGSERLEGIFCGTEKGIRPLRTKNGRPEPNRDLRLYVDALLSPDITVLAIDGLMGTGKTSTCVEILCDTVVPKHIQQRENGLYIKDKPEKILIAKPNVNAGGEDYGFLPGDIEEKLEPGLRSFRQYFDMYNKYGYEVLKEVGYIETLPLGFIRGLNAEDTTIVVDECQNTSELVTVVTRKARNSRVILMGDTSPFQIDKYGNTTNQNGLKHISNLLNGAPYFQLIEMKTLNHVVRSSETRDIIRRLFVNHGEDIDKWCM